MWGRSRRGGLKVRNNLILKVELDCDIVYLVGWLNWKGLSFVYRWMDYFDIWGVSCK